MRLFDTYASSFGFRWFFDTRGHSACDESASVKIALNTITMGSVVNQPVRTLFDSQKSNCFFNISKGFTYRSRLSATINGYMKRIYVNTVNKGDAK